MDFTLRDVVLAWASGLLLGAWGITFRSVHRKERPIAKLVSAVVEPLVYWFDLTGPDGRPSHTKIVYVLVVAAMLTGWSRVAGAVSEDPGLGFLGFTVLVMAFGLGKRMFERVVDAALAWKGKLGNLVAAQQSGTHVGLRLSAAEQAHQEREAEREQ